MVKSLRLAPASVSAIVSELMSEGLIIETGALRTKKSGIAGRPSREIALNPKAAYVVGMVLKLHSNTLFIEAIWCDYAENNSKITRYKVGTDFSYDAVLNAVEHTFLLVKKEIPYPDLLVSVAVGLPGVVDGTKILHLPKLSNLLGNRFHRDLKDIVGVPLFLENDVNLALMSEVKNGQPKQSDSYGYLLISEGVGAGISLADQAWKSKGWSGEIGHIKVPIIEYGFCRLESIIGLSGVLIEKMLALGLKLDGEKLVLSKVKNSDQLNELLVQYANYMLIAIQALNAALGLDKVILNSQQSGFLRHIVPLIEAEIDLSPLKLEVAVSNTSNLALVQGATHLALKNNLTQFATKK